jgi:hypothetical protein
VHSETLALMVAVMADFVFNCWDLEIVSYRYRAQSLRLEAFESCYYMTLSGLWISALRCLWNRVGPDVSKELLPSSCLKALRAIMLQSHSSKYYTAYGVATRQGVSRGVVGGLLWKRCSHSWDWSGSRPETGKVTSQHSHPLTVK